MKIWKFICLLFLIQSIKILNVEKYETNYQTEKEEDDEILVQYTGCYSLVDIFENRTKIDLNKMKNDLIKFFIKFEGKKRVGLIFDKIESKDYFIYRNLFCLNLDKEDLRVLFIKEDYREQYFAYDKETYEFFKLKNPNVTVSQIIIYHLEYPYSKCYRGASKFDCLEKCLKQNYKLAKYYYEPNEPNENQMIHLNIENEEETKLKEFNCSKQCEERDCKLVYFVYNFKNQSDTTILKSYPLVSEFTYLVEFIGLICFFTDICFYQLLVLFFDYLKSKVRNRKIRIRKFKIKIKKILAYLYLIILLSWLAYLIVLYVQFVLDYILIRDNPVGKEISINLFKPKLSLMFCMAIAKRYFDFSDKTLLEIENRTSTAFADTVHNIYLEFLNDLTKIDYIVSSKVWFKRIKKHKTLSRCFHLQIYPKELKYESILAITKLSIETNHENYSLYLLPDKEKLNSKSYENKKELNFFRKFKKRSKLNTKNKCDDYNEQDFGCQSMQNCVDNCISMMFFEKYKNISYYSIIDKSLYTDEQWTTSYLNFSYENYNQIKKKCKKLYSKIDCNRIYFKVGSKIDYVLENKVKLNLYYDTHGTIEEEPSIYNLVLYMVNIQSIIFGLQLKKLFLLIFYYSRIKFKFKNLFIFILCLIGFSYHCWFIFDEIINGEFNYSQYFSINTYADTPEILFCFSIDKKLINENYKFSYKYLDEITEDLTIENVFDKIKYLNKMNDWIVLNASNFFEQEELIIETVYFKDQKCFQIRQDVDFERNQFYYKEDEGNDVLRIIFNRELIERQKIVHFLTRLKYSMEFSKSYDLNFENYSYSVHQELFEIQYIDKFNLIKNPMFIFYESNNLDEVNDYLNKMINRFQIIFEHQTLKLPIDRDDENLNSPIDDLLFDQYFKLIQNVTDHEAPLNPNYLRTFSVNYLEKTDYINSKSNDTYDFEFGFIFFIRIIEISNKDNYVKLILNLVNVLSIWFSIGVLDLYIIFYKIKFLFTKLYQILVILDKFLFYRILKLLFN